MHGGRPAVTPVLRPDRCFCPATPVACCLDSTKRAPKHRAASTTTRPEFWLLEFPSFGRGGCQIACKQGDLPRPQLSVRPPTVGAPPSAGRTGKIRTMRAQEGGGWDGRRSATEAESPDRLGGMADSSLHSRRGNRNGDPVPKRGLGPNQGRSSGDSRWPPRNHNPGGPTRHEDPLTAVATRQRPPAAGSVWTDISFVDTV